MFDLNGAARRIARLCAAFLAIAALTAQTTPVRANPTLTPGTWTNLVPAAAQVGLTYGLNIFPQGMTMDPSNHNILYFCTCAYTPSNGAAIWKTTDGGSTWTALTQLDEPIHVRVDPTNGNHLYAVDGVRGNTPGFWVSTNGGTTWTQPASWIPFCTALSGQGVSNFGDSYFVSVEPGNFNHVLVSSHSAWGTIAESTDGGNSWVAHTIPAAQYTGGDAVFFLYSPNHNTGNAQTWLFCTQGDGMWRTTDSGNTWTRVTNATMCHGGQQIYYTSAGVLFAGSSGNPAGPIKSTDNGVTWVGPASGMQSYDRDMGVIGDGTTLYTGLYWENSQALTSPESDGLNWTLQSGSPTFTAGPFEMGYDATNGIVYSSNTDNGTATSYMDGFWAYKVPGMGSAPTAPTGLAAVAGNAQVALTWNASTGATAYDVKRSTVSGSGYATIASPTATNYTNTGLTNGTTYYFVVDAKNSFGTSGNSNEASAAPTGSVPPVPTGLTATPGNGQVSLNWNSSATATAYDVKRSTVSGSGYAVVSSPAVTNYLNTGLTNGTTYYFVVAAKNSIGSSANSSQASATPVAPAIASIAFASTAPVIDGAVDSIWSSATAYSINNIAGTVSSTADLSGTWQGLWDSTNLYLLVPVTDDVLMQYLTNPWDGDSVEVYIDATNSKTTTYGATDYQYEFPWNSTTIVETKHNAITGVAFAQVNVTGGYRLEIKLPWSTLGVTAAANNLVGIDVHINDADTTRGTRDGKRMWQDTTDTAWSNPSVFGTGKLLAGGGPPSAPTGLTATAGNAQVSLSWTASSGATSYNVLRSTVSGSGYAQVTNVATASYTNTGLTNGTTYYFVVNAVNAGGTSGNSNQASGTPQPGIPPVPTGLAATPGNTQVSLSWTASSGATAYDIKRSTVSGSGYVTVASPAVTNYTNTGLTNGTIYYFVVDAKNAAGASANSAQVSATPVSGVPAAPTGLTATPGNAQAALSWTASSGATSYNALRSTVNGSGYASVATGIATTSYTNTGLTNGTTYYFVVTATNAGGTSGNSNQAGATPAAFTINYSGGFTATGLQRNGSATLNGTRLRLTDGGQVESSSAFYTTKVNVASFSTAFSFQLTSATADGMTFTLQNSATTATGVSGSGLGYQNIANSIAVKFDLWNSAGEGSDSTGLYQNGAIPTTPATDLTSTGIDLHSGHVFNVAMNYNGTTLTVTETDATTLATATQTYTVNIPSVIGASTAYAGFTAGTGGSSAIQEVLTWTY